MPNLNIQITFRELDQIRSLDDFDLKMLLSEIAEHGWDSARRLLPTIWNARKSKPASKPMPACGPRERDA